MKHPKKNTKSTKVCHKCRKQKTINHFVGNNYTKDGYENWCKKCKDTYIKDFDSFHRYLKANERPFVNALWDKCLEQSQESLDKHFPNLDEEVKIERLEQKAIGNYMRQQNLPNLIPDEYKPEEMEEDIEIPEYLIEKWGEGYTVRDYNRLEEFEKDMKKDYRIETKSHTDYLKKIAKVSLKMDKAIDSDNMSQFKEYSRIYDNLMKSAKFTAVQRSASDDSGGLNTFSEFYRLLEEEGFIPKFPEEERDIVDKTMRYIEDYLKKLFLNDPQIISDIEMLSDIEDEAINDEGGDLDD